MMAKTALCGRYHTTAWTAWLCLLPYLKAVVILFLLTTSLPSVCAHGCWCLWSSETLDLLRAGDTGSCEPPDVDAEDQIQVL